MGLNFVWPVYFIAGKKSNSTYSTENIQNIYPSTEKGTCLVGRDRWLLRHGGLVGVGQYLIWCIHAIITFIYSFEHHQQQLL